MDSSGTAENTLIVDFVDERFEASPDEELTFGRAALVVLDEDNEYMSRIVGSFVFHQGTWWLQNRSSSAQLTVVADTGQQKILPPDTSDPMTVACGAIRFRSGRFNYELRFELADPPSGPGRSDEAAAPPAKATEEFGVVPLNAEQRAMLALFANSWLVDAAREHHALPPNAEVAHQLGWSLKKLDRKLDYLCARLSDAGVLGLRGARGGEASDRRRHLVEHVIQARLITAADIPDL